MDQQSTIQLEAEILDSFLQDLMQLVVAIQDEAILMTEHAELVEEYINEVQDAEEMAELEQWVMDLDLDNVGVRRAGKGSGTVRHGREDSGLG